MAIGTGLALLGSAAIGAGASLIGGKKQSKAAKDAANIASQDNAANRAFLSGIYDKNVGYLQPWMQSGQTANNAYMELLGLAPPPQAHQPQPSAFAGTMQPQAQVGAFQGMAGQMPNFQIGDTYQGYGAFNDRGLRNLQTLWQNNPANFPTAQGIPTAAPVQNPVTAPAPSARSAFDNYRNSTGYNFRFDEGTRGLQAAFSRNLESGAASKAALRYGQGIASDEFSRYMQMLQGQSQLGLSGASALAGVGQNYGNTVVAGNQSAASAAANARLYQGQNQANMWANLGSSFGGALGYLGGRA